MTDTIAVVEPYYLTEEAYNKGYDRFVDAEAPDDAEPDLSGFTQSATYANHVLPGLRSMAGYDDSGPGTYTIERQVAAISPGCEEDRPAEAELVSSKRLFNVLVEAWSSGAYDAMDGRDRDPSDHRW